MEYIFKTSTKSSNAFVVLNPKAHLKHSSLGLNYMSIRKNHNEQNLSTISIPTDEKIKLLDTQNRDNSSTRRIDKQTTRNLNELISSLTSSSTLAPCVHNADLNDQQTASSSISLLNILSKSSDSSLAHHTAMTTAKYNRM